MPRAAPDRPGALRRIARMLPGGLALGRWLARHLDPDRRALDRVRRRHGDALFQPETYTEPDRYAALFDALAARLAPLAEPRILSFGCSSGEEVRALRDRLPHAAITGVDINPRAIAQARAADRDPRSRYLNAAAPPPGECFDAVLALAVLRHADLKALRPASCTAVLPFARFAAGVARLDAAVAPGGWLAIWNAHFRFADTDAAAHYAVDPFRMPWRSVDPLYGPDDARLDGEPYDAVLFGKRAAGA